jgi:hypothetical protein
VQDEGVLLIVELDEISGMGRTGSCRPMLGLWQKRKLFGKGQTELQALCKQGVVQAGAS